MDGKNRQWIRILKNIWLGRAGNAPFFILKNILLTNITLQSPVKLYSSIYKKPYKYQGSNGTANF